MANSTLLETSEITSPAKLGKQHGLLQGKLSSEKTSEMRTELFKSITRELSPTDDRAPETEKVASVLLDVAFRQCDYALSYFNTIGDTDKATELLTILKQGKLPLLSEANNIKNTVGKFSSKNVNLATDYIERNMLSEDKDLFKVFQNSVTSMIALIEGKDSLHALNVEMFWDHPSREEAKRIASELVAKHEKNVTRINSTPDRSSPVSPISLPGSEIFSDASARTDSPSSSPSLVERSLFLDEIKSISLDDIYSQADQQKPVIHSVSDSSSVRSNSPSSSSTGYQADLESLTSTSSTRRAEFRHFAEHKIVSSDLLPDHLNWSGANKPVHSILKSTARTSTPDVRNISTNIQENRKSAAVQGSRVVASSPTLPKNQYSSLPVKQQTSSQVVKSTFKNTQENSKSREARTEPSISTVTKTFPAKKIASISPLPQQPVFPQFSVGTSLSSAGRWMTAPIASSIASSADLLNKSATPEANKKPMQKGISSSEHQIGKVSASVGFKPEDRLGPFARHTQQKAVTRDPKVLALLGQKPRFR